MRIGILEDDQAMADHLESIFTEAGHDCIVINDGQRLISILSRETMDLLILDWNVPGASGLALIKWLRQNFTNHIPVLMLTSRTDADDIVTALEAGADEYVVKPVVPAVLLARVNALLRLAYPAPTPSSIENFGAYSFNTRTETLAINGVETPLTTREFALALLLFRNMDRTLSRSYIFQNVWSTSDTLQTRTLDTHISKLRNKIGFRADKGFRLVSIYGHGYRLENMETDIASAAN